MTGVSSDYDISYNEWSKRARILPIPEVAGIIDRYRKVYQQFSKKIRYGVVIDTLDRVSYAIVLLLELGDSYGASMSFNTSFPGDYELWVHEDDDGTDNFFDASVKKNLMIIRNAIGDHLFIQPNGEELSMIMFATPEERLDWMSRRDLSEKIRRLISCGVMCDKMMEHPDIKCIFTLYQACL